MQNVSSLYEQIIAGDHWFEAKLEIRNPKTNALVGSYGEDKLFSISTNMQMLQATFEIGNAPSAEIDVKMVMPSETIPTMAKLIPYVRACNSTQQSEWLMQGVFYIDTRERSVTQTGEEALVLHGYDAMLKAEQMHTRPVTVRDCNLVRSIARAIGLKDSNNNALVDQRTWDIIDENNGKYDFTVSPSYAMRDTLRNIACAYAGWFVITETGYLRLISVTELPKETNYLVDESYDRLVFGTGANATKILV